MYIVLKLLNTFKIYRCDFSIFFVFGFSVLFPFVSPPMQAGSRTSTSLRPHFRFRSPVLNSSSHLPTCQFPPWMPHLPR